MGSPGSRAENENRFQLYAEAKTCQYENEFYFDREKYSCGAAGF